MLNDNEVREMILDQYNLVSKSDGSGEHTRKLKHYTPKGVHPKHFRLLKHALAHLPESGHFLDVCTGSGVIARILSRNSYTVSASDSTEIAGDWMSDFEDHNINLLDLRIEDGPLPLPDSSVDYIYFGATLEHLHNSPRPILLEFLRVLRPGGSVFIDVPNFLCLRHRILMLLGINVLPSIEYIYHSDFHAEHHREYTLEEAKSVVEWSGFEIQSAYLENIVFNRTLIEKGTLSTNRGADFTESATVWDYSLPFNPMNWFDWIKIFGRGITKIFPNLRDDIVVIARKPE